MNLIGQSDIITPSKSHQLSSSMTMKLCDDLYWQVMAGLHVTDVSKLLQTTKGLSPMIEDQILWKRLFHTHHLSMVSLTDSFCPQSSPTSDSVNWKTHFKWAWITKRNWLRGSCRWSYHGNGERVCLALDGSRHHGLCSSHLSDDYYYVDLLHGTLNQGSCQFNSSFSSPIIPSNEQVSCAIFLHPSDASLLLTGSRHGVMSLRDLRCPSEQIIWRQMVVSTGQQISCLATAGDQSASPLVFGSVDGLVGICDMRKLSVDPTIVFEDSSQVVTAVAMSNQLVAVGTECGQLIINGRRVLNKSLSGQAINCMSFGREYANQLFVGGDQGLLQSIQLQEGADCKDEPIHQEYHVAHATNGQSAVVCLSESTGRLVLGCSDGVLRQLSVHDLMQSKCPEYWEYNAVNVMTGRRRGVIWQVHCDSSRIMSSSLDRCFVVHDFAPTVL